MGYDVAVLDPDPNCPMAPVASHVVTAPYADADAAAALARRCAVVTLEIEQIPRPTLEAVAAVTPLRPGAAAVHVIQDRGRQNDWLRDHGFPVGPYRTVTDARQSADAVGELGPSIVKSCFGGYDGRGQVRVRDAAGGESAWHEIAVARCVVEAFLDIAEEVSVLVARRADGATEVYPPSRNHHTAGVLAWAVTPAGLSPALAEEARELARGIAEGLGIVGLLAVELFRLADGRLLVNELAPRPHNTFHHSERACETSQFEQLVRAVCGLPLGSVAPVRPASIANLLGDLWQPAAPRLAAALQRPGVRLHLYGKAAARPGRKMGHLSATGDTAEEALAAALDAYDALGGAPIERAAALPGGAPG
jgi:5-(carboxyamino)imidazole ribonucleotide synthase